jgi:hypothetical protein
MIFHPSPDFCIAMSHSISLSQSISFILLSINISPHSTTKVFIHDISVVPHNVTVVPAKSQKYNTVSFLNNVPHPEPFVQLVSHRDVTLLVPLFIGAFLIVVYTFCKIFLRRDDFSTFHTTLISFSKSVLSVFSF